MATLNQIQQFLKLKTFAVAGVSRNPKKFGYQVFSDLKKKGYKVYPVNPNTDVIDDEKCFRDISELPSEVTHLLIVTPKDQTTEVMRKAVEKGITHIWIQQMSETPESIAIADENNIHLVTSECIHMFAEPVEGFHRFHRGLKKFFGRYPKPAETSI
jgi:hypothetical protein